ncbi:MAG TPA: hypothetical protein PKZ76_10035, partial [Xanthomonadaceae bacterium]|nr:hypothetical protein [Xanthomonadaceae bacterium]
MRQSNHGFASRALFALCLALIAPVAFAAPQAPSLDTLPPTTTANPILVSGSAEPGVEVIIAVNGEVRRTVLADSGTGAFATNVPLYDGVNAIHAVAVAGGEASPDSNTVQTDYTNNLPRNWGGTLAADTVWTAGDGTPYSITSNFTVPVGVRLWLQPGVAVRFPGSYAFTVSGELEILGTTGQQVTFASSQASPAAGQWPGVVVSVSAQDVRIEHARIEHATRGIDFNGG